MADAVPRLAEQGGAAVAVASASVGIPNSMFGWLNGNSQAVLALCAIVGVLISYLGHRANKAQMQRLYEAELRAKERRHG